MLLLAISGQGLANKISEVVFVSDELVRAEHITGASLVIERLKQKLSGQLKFTYVKASRKREWLELHSHHNVCLYNKIKTPKRMESAYFSALPIQIFPPNQIITIDSLNLPDEMSIASAINIHQLKIAIQAGRSYGKDTDSQLKQATNQLVVVEGGNSTDRVLNMLLTGRVDAIIEYSAVIDTNIKQRNLEAILDRIKVHRIIGGAGFAHGYIACAKTQIGKEIIDVFNSALSQNVVQQMLVEENLSHFPTISHASISQEWHHMITDIDSKR